MYEDFDRTDNFHDTFKFFKTGPLSEIIDIDNLENSSRYCKKIKLQKPSKNLDFLNTFENLEAYELINHTGFIIIKNAVSSYLEKKLVKTALVESLKGTHKTNLSPYTKKEEIENLWENYKKVDGKKKLLKKLRWITFGYHHNWDTKIYDENNKSEVPDILNELAEYFAECCSYRNFKAEAGIINIYHNKSSLAGHVDYSEQENNLPLISLSLGCTAIFLIGGKDKSTKPTALFLKSGDVIIMSGPSRSCYHAVPRIIMNSYEPQDIVTCYDEMNLESFDWKNFANLLKETRINFNIRQVNK